MKLFIDVKNKVHDASGVENPQNFYWGKSIPTSDVYYPIREVEEDEVHEEIRDFMSISNLPTISLDEVELECFTKEQREKRDFFMSIL